MESIVVFTGPLIDATMRQAKLEASGVHSKIPDSEMASFEEPIFGQALALHDVIVAPEDEARAREILARPDRELLEGEAAS